MGDSVPTMPVRWRKLPDRIVRINVSDYDPAVHLPVEPEQDVPLADAPDEPMPPVVSSISRRGRRR